MHSWLRTTDLMFAQTVISNVQTMPQIKGAAALALRSFTVTASNWLQVALPAAFCFRGRSGAHGREDVLVFPAFELRLQPRQVDSDVFGLSSRLRGTGDRLSGDLVFESEITKDELQLKRIAANVRHRGGCRLSKTGWKVGR